MRPPRLAARQRLVARAVRSPSRSGHGTRLTTQVSCWPRLTRRCWCRGWGTGVPPSARASSRRPTPSETNSGRWPVRAAACCLWTTRRRRSGSRPCRWPPRLRCGSCQPSRQRGRAGRCRRSTATRGGLTTTPGASSVRASRRTSTGCCSSASSLSAPEISIWPTISGLGCKRPGATWTTRRECTRCAPPARPGRPPFGAIRMTRPGRI
mmetsp:Transcript_36753/g.118185  ORF Transcript_36753/g.118185 Transcript_36753/m.118185 type:complete len:209 (-) Transcript_36753:1087-1713(-)